MGPPERHRICNTVSTAHLDSDEEMSAALVRLRHPHVAYAHRFELREGIYGCLHDGEQNNTKALVGEP